MEDHSLEYLINYALRLEKNLEVIRKQILSKTTDFEVWNKYSLEKRHYNYLLGINTKIRQTLEKADMVRDYRHIEVDVRLMLHVADVLIEKGEYTEKDKEELKQEMVRLNFGSMVIDW